MEGSNGAISEQGDRNGAINENVDDNGAKVAPQREVSLQDRLTGLRRVMIQLMREYDAVDIGTILDSLIEAFPDDFWTRGTLEQVIRIAMRDGVIFSPRPDFYRLMGV